MRKAALPGEFDGLAFFEALDARRLERGLSWRQVADQIWDQSAELNRRRVDHPISPSTITGIAKRGDTTCQHALFFLRWLDRTPESFLTRPPADIDAARLPPAGPDKRLRWNLGVLHEAVDARRRERGLTWPELARDSVQPESTHGHPDRECHRHAARDENRHVAGAAGRVLHPRRRMVTHLHVGGLVAAGFDPTGAYLLTITHAGRGVFSTQTWERVARDANPAYPDHGVAIGIGPIAEQAIPVTGMDFASGSMTLTSPDGRIVLTCESSGISVTAAND